MRHRMRTLSIAACAVALAGLPALAAGKNAAVTKDRVGRYHLGMLLDDAHPPKGVTFAAKPTPGCVRSQRTADDLQLLFENNFLARIYVYNPAYKTEKGIGIGSTEAEVKAAYGKKVEVEPRKYEPTGHDMFVIDLKGRGFNFETDGNKVVSYSLGRLPAIRYVEGCS